MTNDIETMKVAIDGGSYMIINKADYNDKIHMEYIEPEKDVVVKKDKASKKKEEEDKGDEK